MDPITLSRWQFALTTIYHWLFVPLTLGLGWFVAFMQTRYYQTKDETWHKMTKFWGKLFLINFAIGVVTGIVQEFQFGMNWSRILPLRGRYLRRAAGSGSPAGLLPGIHIPGHVDFRRRQSSRKSSSGFDLAGRDRLEPLCLWILLANGWMQHPVGYVINEANGRAELVNFFALIGNPKGWIFFWHTISDGLAMAAFLILAVSAYHICPQTERGFLQALVPDGAVGRLIASVLIFLGGHTMGQYMYEIQPMKLAAIEAHLGNIDNLLLSRSSPSVT